MAPTVAELRAGPIAVPVAIIGGGPAGLATSYELKRRDIEHVVLERGDRPGFVWANLYDSLTLHTGRHMSHLPGMAIPSAVALFPPRQEFADYLAAYARAFELPVRTGVEVLEAERVGEHWVLRTNVGEFCSAALVVATGIVSSPNMPVFDGQSGCLGQIIHSSNYRRPSDVTGDRVLVIGAGNSGGEIASELALAGRRVEIAIRSGVNVVPRQLFGIPIQYLSHWLLKMPRPLQVGVTKAVGMLVRWRRGPSPLPPASVGPLDAIPLIGFNLADAVGTGKVRVRPGVERLTGEGAVFLDGSTGAYDAIIFATGYRAALAAFGAKVRRDAKGFALRTDRVSSADGPHLFMVGHNYDASGGLKNIARDAGLAAERIALLLRPPPHRPL